MKYFRNYPWVLQLLLFVLMTFTMFSLVQLLLGVFLARKYGLPIAGVMQLNETSSILLIRLSLLVQGAGSLFFFLLPAFTFAYLTHPEPKKYLGLRLPLQPLHLLLGIFIMLGAMPLFMLLEVLMSHINFGADVRAAQDATEKVETAFFRMPTFLDFLFTFFVVSVIPAIGEELYFRGVMMRFVRQRSRNMVMPVILSAGMFAFSHANYYGLPAIFLAGTVLAVIYNLSGSLWPGIIAHLFFNGTQVILNYMSHDNPKLSAFLNEKSINPVFVASGALLFCGAFYAMWRTRRPLPANWANNFDSPPPTVDGNETSFLNT